MKAILCLCSLLSLAACAGPSPSAAAKVKAASEERALRVTDMDGGEHDLDAVLREGGTVALVFWQTWCASCIREAPQLARDARAHGDGILFLGVVPGTDEHVDDELVARKAAELALPYPQVRDRDLFLTNRFDVQGTPTIVVLGEGGRVLYHAHRPPADWAVWTRGG